MKKKIFAVTGNPILHSKSPLIFNNIFLSMNLNFSYFRIAADKAEESIEIFKNIGLSGMNVTAPFKDTIMNYINEIDESAKIIGGVNTIVVLDKKLKGFNTDHYGVTESFRNRNIDLENKKVVVLGAGGAGRAASYGLVREKAKVIIVNRTIDKVKDIASRINCDFAGIDDLENLLKSSDILVSTLSSDISLIKKEWLNNNLIIFDANYKYSNLSELAKNKGCTIIKGEEWLINQAIPAFNYFTGKEVSLKIQNELINKLNNNKEVNKIFFIGSEKKNKDISKAISQKINWENYDICLLLKKEIKEIDKIKNIVLYLDNKIIFDNNIKNILKTNSICFWLYDKLNLTDGLKDNYSELADIIINTTNKTFNEIVEKIYKELHLTYNY